MINKWRLLVRQCCKVLAEINRFGRIELKVGLCLVLSPSPRLKVLPIVVAAHQIGWRVAAVGAESLPLFAAPSASSTHCCCYSCCIAHLRSPHTGCQQSVRLSHDLTHLRAYYLCENKLKASNQPRERRAVFSTLAHRTQYALVSACSRFNAAHSLTQTHTVLAFNALAHSDTNARTNEPTGICMNPDERTNKPASKNNNKTRRISVRTSKRSFPLRSQTFRSNDCVSFQPEIVSTNVLILIPIINNTIIVQILH